MLKGILSNLYKLQKVKRKVQDNKISWTTLRPQIGTLLSTLSTIQEVSNAPKVIFSGYPAVHVVPSENSNDYETTKENIRTYAFALRVFYETKQIWWRPFR